MLAPCGHQCYSCLRRESSRHGVSGHIGSRAKPALRTGTKQLPLCGMGLPGCGFKFVVRPSGGFWAGTAGEFRLKAGLRTTQPETQPQASLWVASIAVDLKRHHSSTTFVVSTLTSLLLDHSRHNAATDFFKGSKATDRFRRPAHDFARNVANCFVAVPSCWRSVNRDGTMFA